MEYFGSFSKAMSRAAAAVFGLGILAGSACGPEKGIPFDKIYSGPFNGYVVTNASVGGIGYKSGKSSRIDNYDFSCKKCVKADNDRMRDLHVFPGKLKVNGSPEPVLSVECKDDGITRSSLYNPGPNGPQRAGDARCGEIDATAIAKEVRRFLEEAASSGSQK